MSSTGENNFIFCLQVGIVGNMCLPYFWKMDAALTVNKDACKLLLVFNFKFFITAWVSKIRQKFKKK